jgi:hypothetical protein
MSAMMPALEPAAAPPGIRTGAAGRREARLRPEFAALYPGLRVGEWAPAAVVADRVLAQSLLRASDGSFRGRVLLEAHFEFRHGTSLGGERHGLRLRRKA